MVVGILAVQVGRAYTQTLRQVYVTEVPAESVYTPGKSWIAEAVFGGMYQFGRACGGCRRS
jgi:hypothetical protein